MQIHGDFRTHITLSSTWTVCTCIHLIGRCGHSYTESDHNYRTATTCQVNYNEFLFRIPSNRFCCRTFSNKSPVIIQLTSSDSG